MSDSTRENARRFFATGTCPLSRGARLNKAALASRINGRNIAEMAAMILAELRGVVGAIEGPAAAPMVGEITARLGHMVSMGLGYRFIDRQPTLTGLHMADVDRLLDLLDLLVDGGNSVIVVEHNLEVVAHADWVIDLGPEGGDRGGAVVFEGTTAQVVSAPGSFTGEHLRRHARSGYPWSG